MRQYAIPGIKILLVGNKYDLNNERVISFEMGERFKEENRLDYFVEASAKLGFNTEKIFKKAAMLLYRSYLEYKTDNTSIMTATFRAENNLSFTLTRPRIETKYSNEANKQKMNQINSNNTYDNQKCEC